MSNQIRIAILAGGPSVKGAPLHDKSYAWWGMPWMDVPALDYYFEPHEFWRDADYYSCAGRPGATVEYLNELDAPIFMAQKEPDVHKSIPIPFDLIDQIAGRRYLECTVSYMLAVAATMVQEGDEIAIFGADLSTEVEYLYQRPNAEFWCGLLRGRGVDIYVPPQSALLKSCWGSGYYGQRGAQFFGEGIAPIVQGQLSEIFKGRSR